MMTDLNALLERVKAATGPDRELLDAIWLATIPGAQRTNLMAEWPDEAPLWEYFDPVRNTRSRFIQDFMGSVDAALAFAGRVLPGHQINLSSFGPFAEASTGARGVNATQQAKTPAFAIIAAVLTALIAQEEVQ